MKRAELFLSICLLAVGLVFFVKSFEYDAFSRISGVGPGFFSRGISFIFICLLVVNIISVIRNNSNSSSNNPFNKKSAIQQILFLVTIIATLFLMKLLGMVLSLALFLIIGLRYFENISWLKSAFVSAVLTVGIYVIFVEWCNLSLPKGIFL